MNTNHITTSKPRLQNYLLPSPFGEVQGVRLLLVACLALFCACSSDDDSPGKKSFKAGEKPTWSVNLASSDAAPGWQDIDRSLYESWMYVTVKLEDELAKHASSDDRMVVFIGDEQRTRPSAPNIYADGSVYFVLTIGGNSTDREINIRLCYWSAKLRQTFMIEEKSTFMPELPYGNTTDYVPPLLRGSKKYPVQSSLTVNLAENAPVKTAAGDLVAAFVGEECRGVGKIGQPFTVFRTSADETILLRYYNKENAGVYSSQQSVTLSGGEAKTVTFMFE